MDEYVKSNQFLLGIAAYLGLGAIATMPPKGTKLTWSVLYDWFFDFTHMILNQRGGGKDRPLDPPK